MFPQIIFFGPNETIFLLNRLVESYSKYKIYLYYLTKNSF